MKLNYQVVVTKDAEFDLDLDKLAKSVINAGLDITHGELIYLWQDNMYVFLEQAGFNDGDCLSCDQIDEIDKEVTDRLEAFIFSNN